MLDYIGRLKRLKEKGEVGWIALRSFEQSSNGRGVLRASIGLPPRKEESQEAWKRRVVTLLTKLKEGRPKTDTVTNEEELFKGEPVRLLLRTKVSREMKDKIEAALKEISNLNSEQPRWGERNPIEEDIKFGETEWHKKRYKIGGDSHGN